MAEGDAPLGEAGGSHKVPSAREVGTVALFTPDRRAHGQAALLDAEGGSSRTVPR